jgi:hypothetical protein
MLQEPPVGEGGGSGLGSWWANATWIVDAKRSITTTKTRIFFFIRFSPFKTFSFESLLEPDKLPVVSQTINTSYQRSAPVWVCQLVSYAGVNPY